MGATISDVEAIPLHATAADGGGELVLVVVRTDSGVEGYGEVVAAGEAVKLLVEREGGDEQGWDAGIRRLLVGVELTDPRALWRRLKSRTFWSCRVGIGHCALAGVDTALWDLAGKLAGVPSWQVAGTARPEPVTPYITVWHDTSGYRATLEATVQVLEQAVSEGFRAFKIEAMPRQVPELRDIVDLTAKARATVGDAPLLLDLGYRLGGFREGEELVRALEEFDLFALEAPYPPSALDDYARLRDAVRIPIATGDQLTASVEYHSLLGSGSIDFVQCGPARTGFSDMMRLAADADAHGRKLIPWGWDQSAIGASANLHVAQVTTNVPLVEYCASTLFPELLIRCALASPDPEIVDGRFVTPMAPGLGIEIDWELVGRLRTDRGQA